MVPIVNKAVMGHILDLLRSHGITEIIVTLRYMASSIEDYFDDGSSYGVKLKYVVEEGPLGTAGSVKNAAQHLSDESFLIISGDALTDFDLKRILKAHKDYGAKATITLTRVPDPSEYGVVINNEQGWVTHFLEKPGWSDVISDTVNTGIYVLEPDVLEMIPQGATFDFSQDLFPAMLKARMPLLGHVAEGYWCDVGNINEYIRANADVLYGRIKLPYPIGEHLGGGIYTGSNVDISPSAQLFGPIYLGDEVKIKGNVRIYGPTVVRDYSVVDNYTLIERSILWRNNYVGEQCEVRGAVIVRECSLKPKVMVFEGAVIGDNCVLGEGSVIHPEVKLWPKKEIEAGAVVRDSIIWGNQARRALFGRFGISGVVNVELTPEYTAKLSAALGAILPKKSYVAINRDEHRSSRMLKRALISGLPSAGVNVWDLGTVPIPVLRHFVREHDAATAGLHVRLSPFDQRVVDIRIFDQDGLNLTTNKERAIERNFFREDFRRAYLDDIGLIEYPPEPAASYRAAFLNHVDQEKIRQAGFRLVVDYSHGLAAETMARIFHSLGIEVVALNSRTDESKLAMLEDEFRANQVVMGKIVAALEATVGVQLDVGGEKIFLVDETGAIIDDVTAAALMLEIALFTKPGSTAAAPISMPNAFQAIAGWHDAGLVRIGHQTQHLIGAALQPNMLLVCDGAGNFIFPDFLPAVDGMMATVRLLEYLAVRKMPVSEVVRYLPTMHLAKGSVPCPWEMKGALMRQLLEQYKNNRPENIDGIKAHFANGFWVHISPHPDRPEMTVMAEANSRQTAEEMVRQTVQQLERLRALG
jgi:mannose-1-phosphate guanylyltransferase/phosphomannomutase